MINEKGLSLVDSIIWLAIMSIILPSIYTLFFSISSFNTVQVNSLVTNSEIETITTILKKDLLGSKIIIHNNILQLISPVTSINYYIENKVLKRKEKNIIHLSQFVLFDKIQYFQDKNCVNIIPSQLPNITLCKPTF